MDRLPLFSYLIFGYWFIQACFTGYWDGISKYFFQVVIKNGAVSLNHLYIYLSSNVFKFLFTGARECVMRLEPADNPA